MLRAEYLKELDIVPITETAMLRLGVRPVHKSTIEPKDENLFRVWFTLPRDVFLHDELVKKMLIGYNDWDEMEIGAVDVRHYEKYHLITIELSPDLRNKLAKGMLIYFRERICEAWDFMFTMEEHMKISRMLIENKREEAALELKKKGYKGLFYPRKPPMGDIKDEFGEEYRF